MRVLLVEDDLLFGQALATGMTQAGCTVEWVKDGEAAVEVFETAPYSVLVLDINLPGMSGLKVLKHVRKSAAIPVVIMTARDGVDDRIEGLDLGADDYIVKPFELKELMARLRAVVRRSQGRTQAVFTLGDIELDTASRTVRKSGEWVKLTGREYQILALLMERAGRILSRSDIESHIYRWDDDAESNTVEAAIYTLRKKLGRELINNIRGVGYIINER